MLKQNLKTAFPWYTSPGLRFRELGCKNDMSYRLITPGNRFLPFVFRTPFKVLTINSLKIYTQGGNELYTMPFPSTLIKKYDVAGEDASYIQYFDPAGTTIFSLPCGFYTAEFTYNGFRKMYSEEFYIVPNFNENDYMSLSWRHSCDRLNILYQKGFTNQIYLEGGALKKGMPTIEEEGVNDGFNDFHPTFQKYVENNSFEEVLPEYLVDAIAGLQMHDTVILRRLGGLESGAMRNITTTINWEGANGCYAYVETKFQQDGAILSGTSCCKNMVVT